MTPGFSVKFVINRISVDYKIQITDTTNYTGVTSAYGFYRIEYPDGIYTENSDVQNPDFEIGQTISEFPLRMKNSLPMTGQYRIVQKTFANTGDVETTKVFTFSFVEPTLTLTNTSNLAAPTVSFTDTTDYNSGFYTEVVTRSIVCNFPQTLPISGTQLTTSGSVLNMVSSGNYYEGVYLPTLTSGVTLTGTNHTIEWTKSSSFSFNIKKLLSYESLLDYLNISKQRYDQAKGTTNESKERENYEMVASLFNHIKAKATNGDSGIAELMFEIQDLIYKITCQSPDTYVYSTLPLGPLDNDFFTEGVPTNRVLTINGVAQDLTQNRTWNVGTVTSVGISVPSWMTVSNTPVTQSGVIALGLASGYYIPTIADRNNWNTPFDKYITTIAVSGTGTKTITLTRNDATTLSASFSFITDEIQEGGSPVNQWFTNARARSAISLTTTGSSGAATYSSSTGVLNIPSYTLAGLGGVPTTRTITINGQTFDLSQNRTYTIDVGVSSIVANAPISVSASAGSVTVSHNNSGVTPGTYNSVTVDAKGHITSGSNQSTGHVIQNNGVSMTQRANLNFIRMIVQDNLPGLATNVTRPPSVTISTNPPATNLLDGDEWINDNTWKKYAWYDGYWAEVGKTNCSSTYTNINYSPYSLLPEGATNGQVLAWSSANNRYQPTTLVIPGSKWTDSGSDVYRNSRVLVGSTTFTDSLAKLEVNGRMLVTDLSYSISSNSTISTNTTLSISMTEGVNLKRYLLSANLTINFSADLPTGRASTYTFVFRQDAIGARTVTWNTTGTTVLWQGGVAPLIGSAVNEITVITIIWTGQEYLGVKSCGFNV